MTSKCLLLCSLFPPGNLVLWSLQDPRSRIQGPAAPHSCARCTVRASDRFCLTSRALLGVRHGFDWRPGCNLTLELESPGFEPSYVYFCVTQKRLFNPSKTIIFSAIKWRFYYLLLGFLRQVMCLAYNKQLINGRYNQITAKIVITLCTLLPWIRIDERNQ